MKKTKQKKNSLQQSETVQNSPKQSLVFGPKAAAAHVQEKILPGLSWSSLGPTKLWRSDPVLVEDSQTRRCARYALVLPVYPGYDLPTMVLVPDMEK